MSSSQSPAAHPPYYIFDVRCFSANGLKRCMGEVPIEFNSDGVAICCTGENEWSLVHMDECGLGQAILNVVRLHFNLYIRRKF